MLLFFKNLVFTVLVPGTVAVLIPYRIVSRAAGALSFPPGRLLLAAPAFALGAAIYFWCLWDFAVAGRGTPAPIDPPKQLVERGLYLRVRNPMYLRVLLVVAACALLFRSRVGVAYRVAVGLLFHLFVVPVAETMVL